MWLPAVQAVGLDEVRFHDLRHTHAALLVAEGTHPNVIQSRLGHASIRTTLDVYGHLLEGLDEDAADQLDAVFESSARPPAGNPREITVRRLSKCRPIPLRSAAL